MHDLYLLWNPSRMTTEDEKTRRTHALMEGLIACPVCHACRVFEHVPCWACAEREARCGR